MEMGKKITITPMHYTILMINIWKIIDMHNLCFIHSWEYDYAPGTGIFTLNFPLLPDHSPSLYFKDCKGVALSV